MKSFRKYKNWVLGAIALVLVVALYFVYKNNKGVVKVTQVKPENAEVVKSVSASGKVTSQSIADLTFRTSTKITKLNAKEGQQVENNFLIAKGDAYSSYNTAQGLLEAKNQAIAERDKYIKLYQDDLESAGGRSQYELELNKRVSAVNQATANYNAQISSTLSYIIKAPFSGTIVDVYKNENENVTAAEPIAKLVDLNSLYFEASVDQEDIGLIKVGQNVEVDLDAYNLPFKGTVVDVPKYVDSESGTVKVKVDIDQSPVNKDLKTKYQDPTTSPILFGMVGDINIITKSLKAPNALEFDYIFSDEDKKTYIWVVENSRLKKMPVTVSLEGDIYTVVNEDLTEKTIVVPNDNKQELFEGSKVQITK